MEDTVKQQRTRLWHIGILALAVTVHILVCVLLFFVGLMNIGPLQFAALVFLALSGFLTLALFVAMEWNLGLARPDMMLVQMLWAVTVVIVLSQLATELMWLVMLLGIALILVVAGRLNNREFLIFVGYSVVALGLTALYSGATDQIASLIILLVMLLAGGGLYRLQAAHFERRLADNQTELVAALADMRELTVRDEATGLYNRRHIQEILGSWKALADRYGHNFSLCLLRLDSSEGACGKPGMYADDRAVAEYAHHLRIGLRHVDSIGRFAGNIFALVLCDTTQREAAIVAERLAGTKPAPGLMLAFGITEYRCDEDIETMIGRAGMGLCEATRSAETWSVDRRIVIAGEEPPSSLAVRFSS